MKKALRNFIRVFFLLSLCVAPQAMAATLLDDFLKPKDLHNIVISPNGHYLAKLTSRGETNIITITDLQREGAPVVSRWEERLVRPTSIAWGSNERLLVSMLVPYNLEAVRRDWVKKQDFDIDNYLMFGRILSMDVKAKNILILMDDETRSRGRLQSSIAHTFLPKDPGNVLIRAYRDGAIAFYRVNIYSGAGEIIIKGSRNTISFTRGDNENTLFRFDYLPRQKKVVVFELTLNGRWGEIDEINLGEADSELCGANIIGPLGENLIYRKRNDETGFFDLMLYKSKEKKYETLVSSPGIDILFPVMDAGSGAVKGYAVDGDYVRYKFFDVGQQNSYDKLIEKIGSSNVYIASSTADNKKLIIYLESAENPGSYMLYDLQKDEFTFLGDADSNVVKKNLSYSAIANYATRDGQKIHSYLLLPKGYREDKKYPLIIMPHGGPQSRDRAGYDDFAQFLSTRGYIVMKPNFRGSIGSGRAFEETGYKQWGRLMQDDLADAAHFMIKKGYADPQKICIVGMSYGGYAALMGAVKNSDIYRCSVSINGVTDLTNIIESAARKVSDENLEKYWYRRIGDPKADKDMLDANSPVLQAGKINIPVLLVAGDEDDVVPFAQATAMVKALKKEKKDFHFLKLKGAGHNPFVYRADTAKVYSEVEQFLAKSLTP